MGRKSEPAWHEHIHRLYTPRLQLVQQQQAEKYQVIMTELIRAKAITLLLDRAQGSSLMYADESFDLTQEVVDAMNQKEE